MTVYQARRYHQFKVNDLEGLYQAVASCSNCDLCRLRTQAVPGEGSPRAEVMFIGEAPGFYEDQQARPFVGPAGRFLDQLLTSNGFQREEVYITNVIKCRPPNNRDPLPIEVEACRGYLQRQIKLIKPRLIVTLGRYSLAWLMPRETISKAHGHLRTSDGRHVMPMYHPAAALHAGKMRKVIEEDFRKIPEALKTICGSVPAAPPEPEPQQIPLF